jgi:glycerol-3-phosphate acyltransferase PlsY
MKILYVVLSAVIGYLLGSINFAVVIGKIFYKKDVREYGSKSAGATNVLRTLGKKAAVFVTIGDLLKAVMAYLLVMPLGKLSGTGEVCSIISGISAVLGHNFPVYFNFKGGKGILTSIAFSYMIDWRAATITLIFALVIMATTKYVSLGSILGCVLNAIIISFFVPGEYLKIFAIVFLVILAIIKHKENIKRLIKGEERKLGQKVK